MGANFSVLLKHKDTRVVNYGIGEKAPKKYSVEIDVALKINVRFRDIVKYLLFFRKEKALHEMDLNISSINDAVWHVLNAQFAAIFEDYNAHQD